ncbi:MAG: transposase zinc-binding domain-containing protein, partial [Dehalococcoidia bacterium]
MIACPQTPDGTSGAGAGARPKPKVVDIFRRHGQQYRDTRPLSPDQDRLLRDIMRCRTAALGGHLWECSACGFQQPHYNSCRNRGCPNCQA